jgi:DNA-binding transcriptional MocR family regulator
VERRFQVAGPFSIRPDSLPPTLDATTVLQDALAAQVAFAPGTAFFAHGGGEHMMRLNFTGTEPDWIEEGIRRLGGVLAHCLGQRT